MGRLSGAFFPETGGQVGICDEELAEGHGVGLAFVKELLADGLIDGFVGDKDTAEGLFEGRADAVRANVLAGGDEGEVAFAELAGEIGECGLGVGVGDAVGIAARGEMHADTAGAEDGHCGFGALNVEAGSVFDGAAVLVGAVVGAILQKLIEEVAVGSVELDAIEAGELGVLSAAAEGLDDAGDLAGFEGSRSNEGALRTKEADGARGRDGAGGDGKLTVEELGVGDAAYVPDLGEDVPAGGMDGGGDGLPGLGLFARPEAGNVGIADPERIDGDTSLRMRPAEAR